MTSSRQCRHKWLIICILCLSCYNLSYCQYKWNWKDPVDLNHVDLGDNKLLLYNGLALGLIHFLSKKTEQDSSSNQFSSFSLEYVDEYRKAPLSQFLSLKYRRGWQWRKAIWLGYEVGVHGVSDVKNILGLGASPFFSWNIINTSKLRISYDNGVGPIYYFDSFPVEGTRVNFNTFYGLNVGYQLEHIAFSLGIKNTHISNASIAGNDRNPGFDGLGIQLKIRY